MHPDSTPAITKVCTKCGRELPLSKFYPDPRSLSRVLTPCRDCKIEYMRRYQAEHREERNAKERERRGNWTPETRSQKNAQVSLWCAEHRDQVKARQQAYRLANETDGQKQRREQKEERERLGLKLCTKCHHEFPATTEFFHTRSETKCALASWCKTCHSHFNSSRSRENREHYDAVRATRDIVRREWAPNGCMVCGFSDLRALDAHHSDPREKECNVSTIANPDRLAKELRNCVPLCRNHHQILHVMWNNGHREKDSTELIAIMREEHEASSAE